jgi:hypothetical protein
MNGFLAGVGEYGSPRFLGVTLFVTPHLHQHDISVLLRFLTVFLCDFLELIC